PKTANDYAKHLFKVHKTTLKSSGFYLICSFGHEVRCAKRDKLHVKKCDSKQFTLHKMTSENVLNTPQCILCERHKTTLKAVRLAKLIMRLYDPFQNGIYLLCACGTKI
ncbi:hypothetical protein PENTCL1PPCAC_3310, partial [Pristionchus entomophagus]